MIDLHSHVLHAIDDGAPDLETAVAMCRAAGEDGCRVIVATPHQRHPHWENADLAALEARRRELQAAVGPFPRVVLGGEVRVDSGLLAAVDVDPGVARPVSVSALAGSRTLLLEFGPLPIGPQPEELLHELLLLGWRPLLAHPECIPWLAADLDLLASLVARGARLQITTSSVLGDFGRGPRDVAWSLVEHRLAHVLASDCHDLVRRPPGLARALSLVASRAGEQYARHLVHDNPKAILEDEPIEEAA